MPASKSNLPAKASDQPEAGDELIISRFLDLEDKKLQLEEQREKNAAKELEYSRKSGEDATEIARIDLDNQKDYFTKSFKSRDRMITYIFILVVVIILIGAGLIFYFGQNKPDILDKLFLFIKDALKVIAGVAIGWLANKAKSSKKKTIDD